jgi:hypothetical protein
VATVIRILRHHPISTGRAIRSTVSVTLSAVGPAYAHFLRHSRRNCATEAAKQRPFDRSNAHLPYAPGDSRVAVRAH